HLLHLVATHTGKLRELPRSKVRLHQRIGGLLGLLTRVRLRPLHEKDAPLTVLPNGGSQVLMMLAMSASSQTSVDEHGIAQLPTRIEHDEKRRRHELRRRLQVQVLVPLMPQHRSRPPTECTDRSCLSSAWRSSTSNGPPTAFSPLEARLARTVWPLRPSTSPAPHTPRARAPQALRPRTDRGCS